MIKNFFSHPPVTLFLVLSFVFTGVLQIKPQVSGMAGGSVASGTSTPVGFFDGQLSVNQGVANYSVPLEVPPGINGLQPNLSLHYTSTNRNGALGVGWSVGGVGSAITRCVSKERTTSQSGGLRARKELRFDRSDKFCLDGMELHQIEGNRYGSDNAVYQTYIDSGRRIVSKGTGFNGPDYFLVYEKNGLISRYGCAENGACSTGAGGTHGLVGASGSVNYTGIARGMWALVEKRTREGDKIEYEYRNTTVEDAIVR